MKYSGRLKIKASWIEAYWKKLTEEDKEQQHWSDKASFERLLSSSGEDKQLTMHLESLFPNETGNAFLVIPKNELREYLYQEVNHFYALKTR